MNTELEAPPAGSAVIAIVGRTNVGKSTLLNRLVGEKVSIVTDTVQTTRNVVRAILTETRGQLVFLDTPGVHKAQCDMGRNANRAARASVRGVDIVLLVLDSSYRPRKEDDGWLRRVSREEVPCIVLLNKQDLEEDHTEEYRRLWDRIREEKQSSKELTWLACSAIDGTGLDKLLDLLFELAPVGPPLFPEDTLTDYPRKLNIADIIREQLFERLTQELPHAIAVKVEKIDEQPGEWDIDATIYVDRSSQKAIVIGKKGRLIKRAREAAVRTLAEMYEVRIKLRLWVKVEKNWRNNFWMLKQLGYTPDK